MCFATARFSQGDSIMKSLCETLNCFCKSTFVSNYFNQMFSSGKASSGTNVGRVPLRKRLPAVAEKGNAKQEWSAFLGAPSSPFKRLTPPKPPSSLSQGPCPCLLCSLLEGLLLLLRGPSSSSSSYSSFLTASAFSSIQPSLLLLQLSWPRPPS